MAARRSMCRAAVVLTVVAGHVLTAGGSAAAVTPVQKVIELLDGMLAKGKEEKHQEAVQYAAFRQFCGDTVAEKTKAVKLATEQMEMLGASIQSAQTSAADLEREVAELEGQIATWSADEKATTKVRELERADYLKAHEDYTETVDALGKAMQVLKAKAQNAPQQAAELQQGGQAQLALTQAAKGLMALKKVPQGAQKVLAAFLAEVVDGPEGEAYAYESKSGGVIDMLQQLKDKFIEERSTLEKEETSKRHAFELEAEDLKNSIANAEQARATKNQQKAKDMQSSSAMQGQLLDTTSTKADDSKYLSDMKATCQQKASDFEDRQKMRADEIEAVGKAIEILSSNQVSGNSDKYLSLLQANLHPTTMASLLQIASSAQSPNQLRVAEFLEARGSTIGSRVLSALAVAAREDPFSKVKKMIQDLINRLQDAASEEAQHESWCRSELAQNANVRTSRETSVERLTSEIDEKHSTIAKLSEEVGELSTQLADVDAAIAEQTKLRSAEKTENLQTIKDSQEAQTAVSQAVTVLKEFYAQAAEAQAFLQGRHAGSRKQEPAVFSDTPYQGMSAEKGGVIGMLEVIQSDFARLESSTSAGEATSQRDYDRQMTDNAVMKAQLGKDIEHKDAMKQQGQQALVDLNNDLSSAEKELNAANAYFEKLKPSCVDAGMSFQERAQRRQEEIESLQEAMRILNGEDLAIQ